MLIITKDNNTLNDIKTTTKTTIIAPVIRLIFSQSFLSLISSGGIFRNLKRLLINITIVKIGIPNKQKIASITKHHLFEIFVHLFRF